MKHVQFTCPTCGQHRLEEVMSEVTVASVVTQITIDDGVANFEYGEQSNEGGKVERFQCIECGYVLELDGVPITDGTTQLAEWFERHNQIVGSPENQMEITQAARDAVGKALGHVPDDEEIQFAINLHRELRTEDIEEQLKEDLEEFEESGGRGVGLADKIDRARIVIAARKAAK